MNQDFLQDPALLEEFLVECEELLQDMDLNMVTLESTPADADLLNRVFRALHTIKGTAGFLGFDPLVQLSHNAEDVLNQLRKFELALNPRIIDVLLRTRDQMGAMLVDIRQGSSPSYDLTALLQELQQVQSADLGRPAPSDSNWAAAPAATQDVNPDIPTVVTANPATSNKAAAEAANHTLRVDARKLDELINLIGEIVLERNRLLQLSRSFCDHKIERQKMADDLSLSAARLSFITEELQTAGLRTRMVPIETVFRKFPRMVRDVSHALNKQVDLELVGQDTELDKSMVEMIADPLVHLVRNSLDHGIEPSSVRIAAGKPACGRITLTANQQGDQIIITLQDDGSGIDPECIGRKAVDKGLVTPEHLRTLSRAEILDFIFLPGFSTAAVVTDISGRGVGMDVVRTNISRLSGTVEIDSIHGAGTTLRLRLPLTVAILPVLLVEVRGEAYALPLRSVQETRRVVSQEIHCVESREVLHLREGTLPLLRLTTLLNIPEPSLPQAGSDARVVILHVGEKRLALLVDRLLGQESTVIKPLSSHLAACPGLAGATISGDGQVRLVLDPAGLLHHHCADGVSAQRSHAAGGAR